MRQNIVQIYLKHSASVAKNIVQKTTKEGDLCAVIVPLRKNGREFFDDFMKIDNIYSVIDKNIAIVLTFAFFSSIIDKACKASD
jgi:hypothetical protein